MSDKDCKITARIEEDLYEVVHDKFYHGQQTLFFKSIFMSLKKIIQEDRFNEVTDYLYKEQPLTLPSISKE
jgi:hypothetical protein